MKNPILAFTEKFIDVNATIYDYILGNAFWERGRRDIPVKYFTAKTNNQLTNL